jgi:hypothetical protein
MATPAEIPGVAAVDAARLKPGQPGQSANLYRMSSRHAVAQMPPLGTRVTDADAVQLIRRWIEELGRPGSQSLSSNHTQPRSK